MHGYDHNYHPFPLSEVEQDVWAMVTAIPFPRRGRNVYGYDHQSFLFVEEEGTIFSSLRKGMVVTMARHLVALLTNRMG